jgi:hypothetical protein
MRIEFLLAGESVPVWKISWKAGVQVDLPGGDDRPFVYYGRRKTMWKGQGGLVL